MTELALRGVQNIAFLPGSVIPMVTDLLYWNLGPVCEPVVLLNGLARNPQHAQCMSWEGTKRGHASPGKVHPQE